MNSYNLKRLALNVFYPNVCPFCGKIIPYDEYFDDECDDLARCRESSRQFFRAVYYNDKSKPLITAAKEHADGAAISAAARLMFEEIRDHTFGVITAVPPSKARLAENGYSFPELLARELAAMCGTRYRKLLVKKFETKEQKDLTAEERRLNVEGAFLAVNERFVRGGDILLVDDVSTTGATMNEATRALFAAGATSVTPAVFAQTPLNV
ncbi:MAG: hypothetical protein LBN40_00525 [Oscillospiraceae bacterium]|jgi:ComF family protein|nr:hypothetical protein [Oscillospiraceae bacterium]